MLKDKGKQKITVLYSISSGVFDIIKIALIFSVGRRMKAELFFFFFVEKLSYKIWTNTRIEFIITAQRFMVSLLETLAVSYFLLFETVCGWKV